MKYYISHGGLNWADEIDFEGFDLFTEDQLNEAKKAFSEGGEYYDQTVNVYIGTNEDEDVSAKKVLKELNKAQEITEAQFNAINDILGSHLGVTCYGAFIENVEYLEEEYDESEDED